MEYKFYSISEKKYVMAIVTEKVDASKGNRKSFILKGKTADGRKLTAMVSEKVFNEVQIG